LGGLAVKWGEAAAREPNGPVRPSTASPFARCAPEQPAAGEAILVGAAARLTDAASRLYAWKEQQMRIHGWVLVTAILAAAPAAAQPAQTQAQAPQPPIVIGPPPPPATALEAFAVGPGAVLMTAYEDLGEVDGVFVEAREMRDGGVRRARGLVVTIAGRQASPEQAYVDPDEFVDLLKGFDALLAITTNPTGQFRNFDMRYSTRGELVLTASSTRNRGVLYGVEVGRVMRTRRVLDGGEFHQLRTLVEAAQQKLATLIHER
jgi:hypothetical protein